MAKPSKPMLRSAEPAPPSEEDRSLPLVAADVFVLTTGRKADQAAAFFHYAKACNLTLLTIPAWEKAWNDSLNRPIR